MAKLSDSFAFQPVKADRVSPQGIVKPEIVKAKTLEDIFEEEPVALDVFMEDKFYIGGFKSSPIQYDLIQHMERIFFPDTYELMAKEWNYWKEPVPIVNFITAQWGKGAGKDTTVRIGYLRIAYLLLCLKSPQAYYEMGASDHIHMLNIAVNAAQARKAFFDPMRSAVKSGWFKDKVEVKANEIAFAKNVDGISGHSKAENQEGLNLLVGVADETDAFASKHDSRAAQRSEQSTIEYMLNMIQSSASSRFPEVFKNLRISYPRYEGSPIRMLTEEAKQAIKRDEEEGVPSRHYVSGPYATWEVNPTKNKEMYAQDYRDDPIEAAAKYECAPYLAVQPFFTNPDALDLAIKGDQPITVDYELKEYFTEFSDDIQRAWTPSYTFAPDFLPKEGAVYAIHADFAVVNDRCAIAMSHVVDYTERTDVIYDEEEGEELRTVRLPIVRNDFVLYYEASKVTDPPRDIQLRWVRELIFELLRRGFAITKVTSDQFQSVDTLQLLEARGIEAKKLSTDSNPQFWQSLRDVVYESRFTMPYSGLLMRELKALSKFGKRIDHPPNGSKDLADAVAGSVATAIEIGGIESEVVAYPSNEVSSVGSTGMARLAGINIGMPSEMATDWW